MKNQSKEAGSLDPLIVRLEAILMLLIELNRGKEGFTEASTARALKHVGLTPTEIARILGKKSATDVAPFLYPKKGK